jgi:TorA maturation chaperone TorD
MMHKNLTEAASNSDASCIFEAESDLAVFSLLSDFYCNKPCKKYFQALNMTESPYEASPHISKAFTDIRNTLDEADERPEVYELIQKEWRALFSASDNTATGSKPYIHAYKRAESTAMICGLIKIYKECAYTDFLDNSHRHDYIGSMLGYLACIANKASHRMNTCDAQAYTCYTETRDQFIDEYINSWFHLYYEDVVKTVKTAFISGMLTLTYTIFKRNTPPSMS